VSGPGWSSILCSLDPTDTGVINNYWLPPWMTNESNPITPVSGNDLPFPCVWEVIKKQNPDLKTSFYFDWEWLNYLDGTTENQTFVDDEFYCYGSNLIVTIECDLKEMRRLLNKIENEDWDFAVIYFLGLDSTGHKYAWCSQDYEDYLGVVDGYLGDLKDALQKKGILDETYILITSDHGGVIGKTWHGMQTDDNILVPWILYGPNVKKNYQLQSNVHNMDSMPTLLTALGLKPHDFWRGFSINEAFTP